MKPFAGYVRGTARLFALAGVMGGFAATFALRPAYRRNLAGRARWLQLICRALLRVLGVRRTASGPVPRGSVIAANHLGYLDIFVLSASAPAVFVAKREVASWPVFGWFARLAGTRFIDREKRGDVARVSAELTAAIEAGLNVILFLEGTSTAGETVRPFKSSLLEPAVRHAWPVVPAALHYRVPVGRSAANEVCWWGDMTLGPHLFNLATLPRIDAAVSWGKAEPLHADRKSLANALHARVCAMHQLLRVPPPSAPASASPSATLAKTSA